MEDGFAHVRDNTLTILSESVSPVEELSKSELEQALRDLETNVQAEQSPDERSAERTRLTAKLRLVEHQHKQRA